MLRTFRFILWKEFLQLLRTPVLVGLLILCPIVTVGLVPFGLGNFTLLKVEVVDLNPGGYGLEMVKCLGSSPHIKCTVAESEQAARKRLDDGKINAYITITPDGHKINTVIDATHTILAQDAYYFIGKQLESGMVREKTESAIMSHQLFSSGPDNTHYYLVTMIILLLAIIGCSFSGLSVFTEKEGKVLEHLRSTGMSATVYIFSKICFFMLVGLVELIVALIIASVVFGFRIAGPLLDYFALSACFLFVIINLGMMIAQLSKTLIQAIYVLVFLFIVLILLGTMFAPIDNMDAGWAATRFVNPFFWAVDGSWTIALKGFGMAQIPFHYLALLGIGGAMTAINIYRTNRVA